MLELLQPFFVSFVIGLFIGAERERSHPQGAQVAGIRTFVLFALLGTLAAKINTWPLTLSLSLFVFSALLAGYIWTSIKQYNNKSKGGGITTEMAGAAVFALGYLVLKHVILAIFVATGILIILYGRSALHYFARQQLKKKEIEASITIIVISLAIISFLPNTTIDPLHLFNPQRFGILVLILAGLQFGGYIAIRLFGERLGMMLTGFFGGLISSTAVFASLSHSERKTKQISYSHVVAGICATIASLASFLVVVFIVTPTLLQAIIWPVITAVIIGIVCSWFLMRVKSQSKLEIAYNNPLDIVSILKLAIFIMLVLLLTNFTKQYTGQYGLMFVSFITGLFDIQAMAYSIAVLFAENQLTLKEASELLIVIVSASFVSKFGLVWVIAHNRFSLIMSLFLLLMVSSASIVYFFIISGML